MDSNGFYFDIQGPGKATLAFRREGMVQVLDIGKTPLVDLDTSVNIFWSYPSNILTLIIETPYTKLSQPYSIAFYIESIKPAIHRVYRVLNGKETEITTTDEKSIQNCDSNYQVILKLQGPPKMEYYGTQIQYDIIKN